MVGFSMCIKRKDILGVFSIEKLLNCDTLKNLFENNVDKLLPIIKINLTYSDDNINVREVTVTVIKGLCILNGQKIRCFEHYQDKIQSLFDYAKELQEKDNKISAVKKIFPEIEFPISFISLHIMG